MDFIHHFVPREPSGPPVTLLLLHGTGGDERDLLPLGGLLAPGAALLSPRGKVLENGMPRFFRRLAEGVFDTEDVKFRAHELAGFVQEASGRYGFDPASVVAVGYSNGANIAAAVLLLHPRTLAGAVLFHAMAPLEPLEPPDLAGVPVFLSAARSDPIVPPEESERLARLLRSAGANVTLNWSDAGHSLSRDEAAAARRWLQASMPGRRTGRTH